MPYQQYFGEIIAHAQCSVGKIKTKLIWPFILYDLQELIF
jgi:hypothetical protein